MKTIRYAATMFAVAVILCSCASSPDIVQWVEEKGAIVLDIKPDAKLNLKGNKGHKLAMCLYQLKDQSMFNQLASNEQGLYKLLECSVFDSSAIACTRIFVDPGMNQKMLIDRAEGTKYVAIVAGYYKLEKDKIIRFYKIPEVNQRYGFLKLKKRKVPGKLELTLSLGPKEINSK
jgi:type VI secretion system VasD/TssJ family lipoprotein